MTMAQATTSDNDSPLGALATDAKRETKKMVEQGRKASQALAKLEEGLKERGINIKVEEVKAP